MPTPGIGDLQVTLFPAYFSNPAGPFEVHPHYTAMRYEGFLRFVGELEERWNLASSL